MLLLVGTGSSWATITKDGDGYYTISSLVDWIEFATLVNNGTETNANAKLTGDFEVTRSYSFADILVGTTTNKYSGTFDGQGHTLTFTKEGLTAGSIAPFRYISGATIKNLITTGSMSTSGAIMGGVVAEAAGTCTIQNCSSSMTLTSSAANDATCGGILGRGDNNAAITVKYCLFNGKIVTNSITNSTTNAGNAGIVAYFRTNSGSSVQYCLNAGTLTSNSTQQVANIARNAGSGNINNCYYLSAFGSATDGTLAATASLLNGSIAYTLNTGNTETLFWGQGNLNKSNVEAYPTLTTETAKKVLQTKIKSMGTTPCVNPGGAVPNPCRFGKVGFKLSASDANTLQTMPAEGGSFTYGTTELETTTGMYCITLPAAATTLILPFDCSTLPYGITAYDVTYSSGDNVTATKVTKITANKPVLINGTAGTLYKFTGDATFGGTYDGTLTNGIKAHTNGALTGVYVDANASSGYNPIAYVPAGSYVLQNGASGLGFYKVDAENTIKITSFRAYLTVQGGSARALTIEYADDETTGIQRVDNGQWTVDSYYNLNGQRVAQPTKGLYIVNGKKVVIK